MKKMFILVFFFIFFLFNGKSVNALSNLPALCQGGMYDYCSQAPKCGEYPVWDAAWEQKSAQLYNAEIFQFCQYKICQGYVPLCCYEMVRTNDKDKCAGYDTLYCLPKQCNQVTDISGKNCAHGAVGWNANNCDINNLDPLPLSQRFPNDVLFLLIDANPNSAFVQAVPGKYPDLWNKYLAYRQGGIPTDIPSIPTATTAPGQPTPTPTPTIPPTPTPTLLPGQPTYTPAPTASPTLTPIPGQPTATPIPTNTLAPGQPSPTPIPASETPTPTPTISQLFAGLVQFTGWSWIADFDPILLLLMLALTGFLIRLFTH